jgi:archaemetzincin
MRTGFHIAIALIAVGCGNPGTGPASDPMVAEPAPPVVALDTGAPPPAAPAPDASPPPAPKVHVLALMPLGDVDDEAIETARASIEASYGWRVELEPRHGLLASAYYEKRKRYRAEKLLDWLGAKKPRDADMIMGLARVDISTTRGKHHDWGICGLAELGGPASVVSTYRIQRKLGPGLSNSERHAKYLARLTDLTAHEFGHQLGLAHCPNVGCIMEDAKGTVKTFNRSTGKLCDDCQMKLLDLGWGRP